MQTIEAIQEETKTKLNETFLKYGRGLITEMEYHDKMYDILRNAGDAFVALLITGSW